MQSITLSPKTPSVIEGAKSDDEYEDKTLYKATKIAENWTIRTKHNAEHNLKDQR